jgi:hypothetical protein
VTYVKKERNSVPLSEGKIAAAVLRRIRGQKAASSRGVQSSSALNATASRRSVAIREAQFSDFNGVQDLTLRLGQGPDSEENWKRLWVSNPAISEAKAPSRIGWVLQESDKIVGFLGSIPLLYEFEGRTLLAAATCRLAVDQAYRSQTHLLVASFFRQKGFDLFVNSTATESAGKMMKASKAAEIPQKDYGTVLFWVLDTKSFATAVFHKMEAGSVFTIAGSVLGSLALKGDIALRRRLPGRSSGSYSVVQMDVNEMGSEFEELWSEKSREASHLIAKRTPEIMRWHLIPPQNRRPAKVLACKSGGCLAGYIIVRQDPIELSGLRRSLVADLIVKNDDEGAIGALFSAACDYSKSAGSHVLDVMGFPGNIRQILTKWKPYVRKYPACPFFYKATDRELYQKLADEAVWYATPFDGDATLWP